MGALSHEDGGICTPASKNTRCSPVIYILQKDVLGWVKVATISNDIDTWVQLYVLFEPSFSS